MEQMEHDEQPTCGKGLVANAALPTKLAELMAAQAEVLERHTRALDPADAAGNEELDAYSSLVRAHRGVASELASLAEAMSRCRDLPIDKIVGIDARGFLFGSAVAYALGVGFVPIRKKGKLPFKTESASYSLEYGDAAMEMHVDSIRPGEKIVLIDDLLATGGTSAAAAALIRKVGGELLEAQFLIELEFLHGREKLDPTPVVTFLKF